MTCEFCGSDGQPHREGCKLAPVLPMLYKTADGRAGVGNSAVMTPGSRAEAELLAGAHNVCGTCAKFELVEGQKLMQAQRFVERLVREEHWQAKHLAHPLNELGICGEHSSGAGGDEMITGRMTKACDAWKDARGGFTLRK